ncbi:hypothetical protein ACFE04_003945 [Oxalis oulophora]
MSSHEQALASAISRLALSYDGAFIGVALLYTAVKSIIKYRISSSALNKIKSAPTVHVSDLRDLLKSDQTHQQEAVGPGSRDVLIVYGTIEPKSAVDSSWQALNRPHVLLAQESADKAVVVQRTQTGFFGWTSDLRALFGRSWKQQESISFRTVPFILVEASKWPHSPDYVFVNMDGSRHPLPLVTVYHQLQPINASTYTLLQAFFGHQYPVGLLDEEKILPLGKDVNAVGSCYMKNGIPEIKSCNDLPYFLTDLTKEQMVLDLTVTSNVLFWSSIVLGSVSIGILGYAIVRNWNKWKEYRQRRQSQEMNQTDVDTNSQHVTDDETEDIGDGELCVICLMRRRQSAFVPCGHLVCCRRCAISIVGEGVPKCPLCREPVRSSIRIFNS